MPKKMFGWPSQRTEDRDVLRYAVDRTAPVVFDRDTAQAQDRTRPELADVSGAVLRAAVEAGMNMGTEGHASLPRPNGRPWFVR